MTSLAIVPVRTVRSLHVRGRAAVLLGAVLAVATAPAAAEVGVHGTPEAVRLEVRDASVAEVLSGLSQAFNMQYQSSANLETRRSGTYSGPLPRVLARILDGYNFVLKTDNGSIALTVLAPSNAAAVGASSAPRVVRRPAEGAPPPPGAAEDPARPRVPASTAAPSPAADRGGPSVPTAARPTPGAPPAVPQVRQSEAPHAQAGRPPDAASPPAPPTPPAALPRAE